MIIPCKSNNIDHINFSTHFLEYQHTNTSCTFSFSRLSESNKITIFVKAGPN